MSVDTASMSPAVSSHEEARGDFSRAFKGTLAAVRRLRSREGHRPAGLSYAQYLLLAELAEHGELAAGELALAAELAPATVTQMLDHLARAGFVVRTRSERDRRVVVSRLADSGCALLEEHRERLGPRWEAALARFTAEELRAAGAVMAEVRAFFDGLAESRAPAERSDA